MLVSNVGVGEVVEEDIYQALNSGLVAVAVDIQRKRFYCLLSLVR
jgi:hypothetical protein